MPLASIVGRMVGQSLRLGPLFILAAQLLSACAHSAGGPTRLVAVMPVEVLGLPGDSGTAFREAVETEATTQGGVELVAPATVASATAELAPDLSSCISTDSCVSSIGTRAGAKEVLTLSIAGLGDTYLIRSRLLEAKSGLVLHDFQETVMGDREAVRANVRQLVSRIFPAQGLSPWYRRWWVWAGGTVLLGAAAATVLALRDGGGAGYVVHVGEL